MDAPAVIYALRWMIRDTFWQTITSRVFWILLGLSALCILFCLGVSIEGGAVRDADGKEYFDSQSQPLVGQKTGRLTLLFGLFPVEFSRSAEHWGDFILGFFSSWLGGPVGVLVALIFAAGFVPESLHPTAASVLLAKPAPRWLLLLGKFLGVVCFVGLNVTIFFVGTWLALGFRTGIFPPGYLVGIPIAMFHFATVYSFSILIAVLTRSSMACVVATVLFWIVCFGVNYGRHFVVSYEFLHPGGVSLPDFTTFLSELGYWTLPKPIDFTIMFEKTLNLGEHMSAMSEDKTMATMLDKDQFHPIASVLTSLFFPAFAIWAAASQLGKTDY